MLSRPGQFFFIHPLSCRLSSPLACCEIGIKIEFFIHLLPWIRCANGGFCRALLKWQIAVGIHSPTPEGNALLLSYSGKYWFNQRCLRMVKTECCWWIVKWYTGTLPFQILPLIPQYWTRLQWEAMHAGSVNTNQLLRYENTWRRKALGLNGRLYKIIGWMRSCEETTDSLWQVGIIFVFDNPGRLIWWLTLIRMDSI